MKLLTILLCLIFLGNSHDLEVEIEGIPNTKGTLFIGLFNSSASFPQFGKQYKGIVIDHNAKTYTYKFKDLPQDTYALAIYHDENNNRKLDKNLFGAPIEAYGFSNNALSISAMGFYFSNYCRSVLVWAVVFCRNYFFSSNGYTMDGLYARRIWLV